MPRARTKLRQALKHVQVALHTQIQLLGPPIVFAMLGTLALTEGRVQHVPRARTRQYQGALAARSALWARILQVGLGRVQHVLRARTRQFQGALPARSAPWARTLQLGLQCVPHARLASFLL